MGTICDLKVEYHQQDNDFCCGAACAQMVLISRVGCEPAGEPLGGSLADLWLQQSKLEQADAEGLYDVVMARTNGQNYRDVAFFTTGLLPGTHPDVLAGILNMNIDKEAAAAGIKFKVFASINREEIACRVAYTITKHGIAPIIMVFAGQHWVVATGCNYVPMAGGKKIEIIDFLIQNPSPALPSAIKHSRGDVCGGAAEKGETHAVGLTSTHVPYATLCCDYMADPIPLHAAPTAAASVGPLNFKYVAVCAVDGNDSEELPESFAIATPAPSCAEVPLPVGDRLKEDLKRPRPKSVEKAITVAIRHLKYKKYSLKTRSPWNKLIEALAQLNRPRIVEAMKNMGVVQVEPHNAPDYFLVPLFLKDESVPAGVVRIALDPDKVVHGLDKPNDFAGFDYVECDPTPPSGWPMASHDLASNGTKMVHLDPTMYRHEPAKRRTRKVHPALFPYDFHPDNSNARLVWTPCRQSFSPSIPFYKVAQGTKHFYVRADFRNEDHVRYGFQEPDACQGGI